MAARKMQEKQMTQRIQRQARIVETEVQEKKTKKQYTVAYKLEILRKMEQCRTNGGVGELLRREGLYSSHITRWRKELENGLASKKPGRKEKPDDSLKLKIKALEQENQKLQQKLLQAERIIEFQKKISQILEIPLLELKSS